MSLRCFPSSLGSICITVWEMSFEEFQDAPLVPPRPPPSTGCHLGCRNRTNLAVLNLHVSPMPPTKFQLNQTYHSRADVISILSSHGGNLGYWNGTNLAMLNLHVAPMPPTKVRLNLTHCLGADMV